MDLNSPQIKWLRWGAIGHIFLAVIKFSGGYFGHSNAMIADGIESCGDILSSLFIWGTMWYAIRPPDDNHPFGHGKAESIAGFVMGILLFILGVWIARRSMMEIDLPTQLPRFWTLPVLSVIIIIKEVWYQVLVREARRTRSRAIEGEAWHQRVDAMTSLCALIGIALSLYAGSHWRSAENYAALIGCLVIFWQAMRIIYSSLNEMMDASVSSGDVDSIRTLAQTAEGVIDVEKCRVRKSGAHLFMDIHVRTDPSITVREGHEIAHQVQKILLQSDLGIADVTVHIEPADI